ncbi:transcription factor HES-3 [Varanus komodoensis]|uniref:transcription factor HES-3 n=1 Tax=Varanus komodoensis TaxID=61221 RepID=UPI001CF7C4F7|nr:transcription factor HES-3 [Varanus komodoensis]
MEKKRRARINLSLEQLKALLEKHCSHQIRKRKLEKADILELSVKYMKSLQHSEQGLPSTPKSADYQAGFWSCLQGVRQLLLSPEAAGDAPAFPAQMPVELALALPAGERGGGGGFSTTDSGPPPALPGCLKASAPKPQALRPPNEDSAPSAGGRGQARGPDERGRLERGQQLWRPW